MSDVIDRIAEARNAIELEHAAADAIDEIKQLRKDVVHWREARRTCIEAGDIMKTEIERLREENTKLWGRWESAEQTCGKMQRRINSLEDENERLVADRDSWANQADARVKDCVEYLSKIERLKSLIKAKDLLLSEWLGEENESNPSSR